MTEIDAAEASRVAVVTGGAQGIGLAICRRLADAGFRVAMVGRRSAEDGDPVAASLGRQHLYLQCDVSGDAQVAHVMGEVGERLGPIEVLVNNAGVGSAADPADLTEADWDTFFGSDLKASWLCVKHALPQLRSLGRGSIINISSIHAHLTRAGMFPYAAAKSGLLGLTRSLALDLAPENRLVAPDAPAARPRTMRFTPRRSRSSPRSATRPPPGS